MPLRLECPSGAGRAADAGGGACAAALVGPDAAPGRQPASAYAGRRPASGATRTTLDLRMTVTGVRALRA
ncbi:hypothetical protein G6F62_015698 [Rhizopus arrhizus]|uniref:Uncharacterized protein n=1 Tax=Rhizopus delemar TaxID=936053 RepID=A0A9P6XNE9_9FUNG|nr:hypothetical protein G6F23_015944 [Rhizopus arrhizus]KAG1304548.1 hypothetical protein G6F62_015698 [Rhizopus arrhizus]KAG1528547.1 hypothetical protein G6F50_018233 [Rhizopus delemar]